ncbi:hypothetical protein BDK88_4223 [Natrinema hispanicum]|uniref:Uncharacterized protein n=1 Tax=Natrinema hispanicum TaxID=392421 RepID=A0A482Y0K8_9EURY|nr:hypothetical protein BDK88_4223 [Natrinema hispanicum]
MQKVSDSFMEISALLNSLVAMMLVGAKLGFHTATELY